MKLKYYLRGLGIGILVTALILSIVPGEKETLSDAEIRERALLLGMVDGNSLTLADVQTASDTMPSKEDESLQGSTGEESGQEGAENESGQENAEGESAQGTTEGESGQESTGESIEKEPVQESTDSTDSTDSEQMVTIVVEGGSDSYTISKNLAEAGLVESAKAFDTYLCDNGYSRSIRVGTYKIAIGTSEEEIAKIISGKR